MPGFGDIMKGIINWQPAGSPAWAAKQNAQLQQQQEDRAAQAQQDTEIQHALDSGARYSGPGGLIQEQMQGPDGSPTTIHRQPSEDEFVTSYPGRKGTQPVKLVWAADPVEQSRRAEAVRASKRAADVQQAGATSEATVGGQIKAQTAGIVPMALEQGKAEIGKRQELLKTQGVPMPPDVAATVGAPPGMMILQSELPTWQQEAAKIRDLNRVKTGQGETVTDLTPGAAAGGTPPAGATPPGAATEPAATPPAAASTPTGPVGRVVAGAQRMTDAEARQAVDAAVPDKASPLYQRTSTLVKMWRGRGNDSKALEEIQRAGEEAGAPGKAAAVEAATAPGKVAQAVSIEKATSPFKVAQQVAASRAMREGDNPALASVPPALAPQVLAAVQKIDQEYIKANAATSSMGNLLDLAEKGNKAAGSNVPLVGVETLNAINGIKRINSAEINQYGSAGSLLDKIQGKLGKLVYGRPIPQDVLTDIRELHQTLGEQSYKGYTDSINSLNSRSGAKFPINYAAPNIRKPAASASSYKPGDTRVVNGTTYIRDDKGIWKPK